MPDLAETLAEIEERAMREEKQPPKSQVNVRLNPATFYVLQRMAERLKISVSEAGRVVLEDGLDRVREIYGWSAEDGSFSESFSAEFLASERAETDE